MVEVGYLDGDVDLTVDWFWMDVADAVRSRVSGPKGVNGAMPTPEVPEVGWLAKARLAALVPRRPLWPLDGLG